MSKARSIADSNLDSLTVDTNTLHVNSTNNNVGIRTTSQNDFYSKELVIAHANEGGITLFGDATNGTGYIMFADGTTGNEAYRGYIAYSHSTPDVMVFGTSGSGRMRILADGKVAIGGTTAEATLDVMGNSDSVAALKLNGGNDNHGFHFLTRATEGDLAINREVGGTQTEAMRIQRSDGAVGIAGTPSNATFDVHGRGRFLQDAAATTGAIIIRESSGGVGGHIQFVTNNNGAQRGFISCTSSYLTLGHIGSERLKVDNVGKVIIGQSNSSISAAGAFIDGNGPADGSPSYFYQVKTFNGTRNAWLNYHSGTYVGGINMTNTSTSFPTSSDERLKKNIVDAPSAGDKIDAMQVRSFNWKSDDSFQEYGLIAQELEPIYDLPVEQHDTEDTYTVDYSKLVPVLLKEIQDLRKRVATLENS